MSLASHPKSTRFKPTITRSIQTRLQKPHQSHMEPFIVSNSGTNEVNGTYTFAKKTQGIPEYWYIKQIELRKKTIDHIFKIRGNASLPQFGNEFENCWTIQRVDKDKMPIQFYAAPMKSNNELIPPKNGWISIGGVDPTPIINDPIDEKEWQNIRESFQDSNQKLDKIKQRIGTVKDNLKSNKNDEKLKNELKTLVTDLKNFRSINNETSYQLNCKTFVQKKANEKLKEGLEETATTNFIYTLSADIYGGCAGLYDYGPTGAAIKSNILQVWRNHFIIEDDMLEVESCMLTPAPVLQASGHVDKFSDYLVKDSVTNASYRADKLIEEHIDNMIDNSIDMNETEQTRLMQIRAEADGCSPERLDEIILKLNVVAPETGNKLTNASEFKLMFETEIGPTGKVHGYLRPETAQGIFTNFHKLLEFNNSNMPFAAAQIGHSFRNEIAPRAGLLRVREFQMAEIEHFCNNDKHYIHPKFKNISHVVMKFLNRDLQSGGSETSQEMSMGDALKTGLITNTTLGYYMARTQLFLEKIGIDIEKLRFRQHKEDEMAHYAGDCWDAEILTSYGWIECVGHADRACFDLESHMKSSKVKMQAEEIYNEPKIINKLYKKINKKKLNKLYRKDAKPLLQFLDELDESKSQELSQSIENCKTDKYLLHVEIDIKDKKDPNKIEHISKDYEITKELFSIEFKSEKKTTELYTPKVVEPSFGIGRILYSLLEHIYWERIEDENRVVMSLKPKIAPIKVGVLPLSNNKELSNIANEFHLSLKQYNLSSRIDDSSANIGRKYSRCDQIGIPFDVTIDFQTIKDKTITIRERDTTKPQIRVKIKHAPKLLRDLSREEVEWKDVIKQYPHHIAQNV